MSQPQHPHRLRQEQAKGAGGEYVPARYAQMNCDSITQLGCKLPPIRAPRLEVFPRDRIGLTLVNIAEPIRKFTTLHYCERHKAECTVELILDSRSPYGAWSIRGEIERIAKARWPHDWKPDFERARIVWMLTTTPEYRRFLEILEETKGLVVDPYSGVPLL